MRADVAVIGAGWAGLTAATALKAAGRSVVVVEKARGPGGRSSTRRQSGLSFDHGAQYFTARDPAFRSQAEAWRDLGLVATWDPVLEVIGQRPDNAGSTPAERWVGVPGMSAVPHALARRLDCRFGWQVQRLDYDSSWTLTAEDGRRLLAEQLVLTAPPAQAAALLGSGSALGADLDSVPMAPCWALLIGFSRPLATEQEGAFVNKGPLSWLARNSRKPGRSGEAWVAHASPEWSKDHLELEPDAAARMLKEAFVDCVPAAEGRRPEVLRAHRWRYSMALEPFERGCLHDPGQSLVVAGDWCAGNRIEGAWKSGRAAAGSLLRGS